MHFSFQLTEFQLYNSSQVPLLLFIMVDFQKCADFRVMALHFPSPAKNINFEIFIHSRCRCESFARKELGEIYVSSAGEQATPCPTLAYASINLKCCPKSKEFNKIRAAPDSLPSLVLEFAVRCRAVQGGALVGLFVANLVVRK